MLSFQYNFLRLIRVQRVRDCYSLAVEFVQTIGIPCLFPIPQWLGLSMCLGHSKSTSGVLESIIYVLFWLFGPLSNVSAWVGLLWNDLAKLCSWKIWNSLASHWISFFSGDFSDSPKPKEIYTWYFYLPFPNKYSVNLFRFFFFHLPVSLKY